MTEEERDKKRLQEIAEEIRNLPYIEDRVGQAFIMFNAPKPPKKQEEKRGDNTTVMTNQDVKTKALAEGNTETIPVDVITLQFPAWTTGWTRFPAKGQ